MKKALGWIFALALLGALAFAGWMWTFAASPVRLTATPLDFTIKPGMTMRSAARQIGASGVNMRPWQFELMARLAGRASNIQAGSYEIEQGITPWQLLEKLTNGDVTQAEIVFIEGWTFRQVRAALDANPDIVHRIPGLSDQAVMQKLGGDGSPEGWFFPDTYLFAKGGTDLEVLARAYRAMQKTLAAEWQSRDPDLPYASPYEALVMASIVEKETGLHSDRSMVAGVFVNRKRLGMLFQTDPSVIYGLGDGFDGNLRKQDLLRDGPYNTYTRAGLPPTPIAMPGLASLRAALHPARTDFLYFVSRGDGTSHFSRNLDEHNRAVAKYQKRKAN